MAIAQKTATENIPGHRLLSETEVTELMNTLPQWTLQKDAIVREYSFRDSHHAITFVTRVARAAEENQHHPDIFISNNKVRLDISTHDVGGLTKQDFDLAAKVNLFLVP